MQEKLLQENKGFSLVELLIAVMIVSIVGATLVAFVQQSSNTYNHNNAELDVQTEAQLTANAITDRVIDCETQLKFYNGSTSVDSSGVTSYDSFSVGYVSSSGTAVTLNDAKILQLINNGSKTKAIIFFDKDAKEIYFNETTWNSTSSDWNSFDSAEAEMLADNVEDFTVNTAKLTDDKILEFDITYASKNKSYTGNYQVHMRNDVVEGADALPPADVGDTVNRVAIYLNGTICERAEIIAKKNNPLVLPGIFTAQVSGTGNVQQKVNWSCSAGFEAAGVKENTDLTSDINFGFMQKEVTPPPDPTIKSFRLTATSVQDPTKSAYVTIYIKKATAIFVNPTATLYTDSAGHPVSVKNASVNFSAVVDGWNLTQSENSVVWKLEKDVMSSTGSFEGNWQPVNSSEAVLNGSTVVLKDQINATYRFRVKATSVFDSTVEGSYVFYISDNVLPSTLNHLRGINMDLKAYFLSNPMDIASDVTSVITIDGIEVTGVDGYSNFNDFISLSSEGVLYVDPEAQHGGSQSSKVKFYRDPLEINLKVDFTSPDGSQTRNTKVTIPAVQVLKVNQTGGELVLRKGNSLDITVYTAGYNLTKESQMSAFLDNVKVSGTGGSNTNRYLSCRMITSENKGSLLGSRTVAQTEAKFRLSASGSERTYLTNSVPMVIALDDYYTISNKAASSYVQYDVYVANVEGLTVFIEKPSGVPTVADVQAWATQSVTVHTSSGAAVQNLKVRTYNNRLQMQYNGVTYTYDEVYKYWKK